FDPALWFIAYDGDEIAGFSLCRPRESGDPDMGWVSVLGVRRPWRRRGLALALLRHSFVELHRRGKKRVGLGVDAENTTGALRLYERAGMHVDRRWDTWEKIV
ncbi:MAG: GNAT family N-acetyltransferase, partial [Thermoleophilia bacterium]|nr:GNAT family N-acetyltransferase [Thermoleophilia bacterium]